MASHGAHSSSQKFRRGRGRGYARGAGRGRDRGRSHDGDPSQHATYLATKQIHHRQNPSIPKGDIHELSSLLNSMNGAPYPRYKSLYGTWNLTDLITLTFDHIQGDAYASPSRARLCLPFSISGFPSHLLSSPIRTTAFCDYLARLFAREAAAICLDLTESATSWSASKGGSVSIDVPSQHVIQRTACLIRDGLIEIRISVALPAHGRTIEGSFAAAVLTDSLPAVARSTLLAVHHDIPSVLEFVQNIQDQAELRALLPKLGLVAFVANNAILPRSSGASDMPMTHQGIVRFRSPSNLVVDVELKSGRKLSGMGLRPGITLIVGGGFHGKSTLLAALAVGMYDKVPGDGREFVCVCPDTVSVRAEDGRSIVGVDISPFINNLPFGNPTDHFNTQDASGSTSQAAGIIEALEAGSKLLLIDEDLAATNFMVRDERMQQLVPVCKEPITPLIGRIRILFEHEGVSSILVVGGTGDYFGVSDTVIMMDTYIPHDVTDEALKIANKNPTSTDRCMLASNPFKSKRRRRLAVQTLQDVIEANKGKTNVHDMNTAQLGNTTINLSAVAQIVEISQTRAITAALKTLSTMPELQQEDIGTCVRRLEKAVDEHGLDALNPYGDLMNNYARPRAAEILAALNRLRGVKMLR